MKPKRKLIALRGGDDWTDASCEHFLIPIGWDFEKKKQEYEAWYETWRATTKYDPFKKGCFDVKGKRVEHKSFNEWLLARGAIKTRKQDVEEWEK